MGNLFLLLQWITAHILLDFPLQPLQWINHKKAKGFASKYLYLHGFLHGAAVWVLTWDIKNWWLLPAVGITHILIDAWKVKRADTFVYFVADQLLHLLVLGVCFFSMQQEWNTVWNVIQLTWSDYRFWLITGVLLFNIFPAAFIIQLATQNWRKQLIEVNAPIITESLKDAGKWIGILERCIILACIAAGRYEGVGILIAAKSILRFNDLKGEHSQKQTEYVLIGTLMSFITGIVSGLLLRLL